MGNTDPTFQVDLTTGFDLGESFYLGLNSTYQDTDGAAFYGVALYPQYQATQAFAIGLRTEYFAELEGGVGAIGSYDNGDAAVLAFTVTGSYQLGDLIIKPEINVFNQSFCLLVYVRFPIVWIYS